jgi:hypothetical protein
VYLVELLIPAYDNDGRKFDPNMFAAVRFELTDLFGGLTVFSRAPAEGLWSSDGELRKDDIVVFQVMARSVDRSWWRDYRKKLEARFRQNLIVVRAQPIEIL